MACFSCEAALLASAADLRPRNPTALTAAMGPMMRRGWIAAVRNADNVPYWTVTPVGEGVLTLDQLARS